MLMYRFALNVLGVLVVCSAWLVGCATPEAPAAVSTRPVAPSAVAGSAAPSPDDPPIVPASEIKRGVLANGLTYYVMKHQKPEQRAALWLAVNAGSVLEDDDQRGVAHFVEHMAFNGTRRFPKQALIDYVEKTGSRFGADLNARTSLDDTVYQLTVPTDDHDSLLKGLDILRDWAGDVAFEPAELDKERNVILEERRRGLGAGTRINDQQWPVLFQGSRYAARLPIGLPEVIKAASRERLVRFYKDWYRPHNMAVIAIGDFEPEEIEQAIAARFADLAEPAQPRPRTAELVPHDHAPVVTIATDRELTVTQVAVYDKLGHRPHATRRDFRRFVVERLYRYMLTARFASLAQDPSAPFAAAWETTSVLTRTCDAFLLAAQPKRGKVVESLGALLREVARVEQHGFGADELARAERELIAESEVRLREWDKAPARAIAEEVTRNFLRAEPTPDRQWELDTMRDLLPGISLDELARLGRSSSAGGRVIAISAPDGGALPSEAELRAAAAAAATAPVEPWTTASTDAAPAQALIAHPPAPGKVVATAHDDAADATVWTLSNGIHVVVKQTAFKNNEVEFEGWQLGGTSLVADQDYMHARFASEIAAVSGVGDLDEIALRKALAGKIASATVWVSELAEQAMGAARTADLETALQLLYMRFTAPRHDARVFAAWKERQRESLDHRTASPEGAFADEMAAIKSGNHLRRRPTTTEMLDKIDLDRALAIYRDRLADVGEFTFVFVGNIDLTTLQPLVETYLGSLPSHGRKAHWKDIGIKYPVGNITKVVTAGSEPKSLVELEMSGPSRWSVDAVRDAAILSTVLAIRLREVLREDMQGTYSVKASARVVREPVERRILTVSFNCDPDKVDVLRAAALGELRAIAKSGIGSAYLTKVTAQLRREHEVNLKNNSWWRTHLHAAYYFHEPFANYLDTDSVLRRVTSDQIEATAKQFLDENNVIVGILRPTSDH